MEKEECTHKHPDGKKALVCIGGFIYMELECEICKKRMNEIDLEDGPCAADPFGSYK